jgi:hypothetical protein
LLKKAYKKKIEKEMEQKKNTKEEIEEKIKVKVNDDIWNEINRYKQYVKERNWKNVIMEHPSEEYI